MAWMGVGGCGYGWLWVWVWVWESPSLFVSACAKQARSPAQPSTQHTAHSTYTTQHRQPTICRLYTRQRRDASLNLLLCFLSPIAINNENNNHDFSFLIFRFLLESLWFSSVQNYRASIAGQFICFFIARPRRNFFVDFSPLVARLGNCYPSLRSELFPP